jgi:hypothetical protein
MVEKNIQAIGITEEIVNFYELAVSSYLNNDFINTEKLLKRLPEKSLPQALILARLKRKEAKYDEMLELLNAWGPSTIGLPALKGDLLFLMGQASYFKGLPSKSHYLKASEAFRQCNLWDRFARSVLNATLDDLLEGDHESALELCHDIENKFSVLAPPVIAMVLRTKLRILVLMNELSRVRPVIKALREQDLFLELPRRDQAIFLLYEIDIELTSGKVTKAKELIESMTPWLGESDINETLLFLKWRLLFQRSGINPVPTFNPEKCLESFIEKARFFAGLAKDKKLSVSQDAEVKNWPSNPFGKNSPPEIKFSMDGLVWNPSKGEVSDSSGRAILKVSPGGQKFRLIKALMANPKISKWQLIADVHGATDEQLANDPSLQHNLHVLVSRLNKIIPGLILDGGDTYNLGKTFSPKEPMHVST